MSDHPAITRVRPIAAQTARPGARELHAARSPVIDREAVERGGGVTAALGCLIVGLSINDASSSRGA